jgi:hypothetical protein
MRENKAQARALCATLALGLLGSGTRLRVGRKHRKLKNFGHPLEIRGQISYGAKAVRTEADIER